MRPLYILRKTLALLKAKWQQDHDYTYICDQFKSMRQDLTVRACGAVRSILAPASHG